MGQVNVIGQVKANNFVQLVDDVLVDKDGAPISGVSAVPWAKFIVDSSDPAVGVDPTVVCNYLISDREVYPGGGLPIFQVNPLAVKKRSIVSKHLYVADFANRPSAVDFPGLAIMIGNFGNAIAVSDGANYVAAGRHYVFNEQNGTLAAPTKSSTASATSHTFTSSIPNIPANLIVPGKTVLRLNYTLLRTGANATMEFYIRIGTAGNSSDPLVTYHAAIAATTNVHARGSCKLTFPDSDSMHTNRANNEAGTGTNQIYEAGPTQLDVTQPLIFSVVVPSKHASDVASLIDLELIWEQ